MIQHLVNALALGALFALFSLGIALIFGVMRLVNFAYGELILAAAMAAYFTSDWPTPMRILAAIGAAVLLGLIQERVAFRPLRGSSAATLLVASFAVSQILQNSARFTIGSRPLGIDVVPAFNEQLIWFGARVPVVSIVTVLAGALLLTGLALFLRFTSVGVQMRAAAENFKMAQLCGVRANRVIATAFGMSGLLAGVGAILLVGQTGVVSVEMGLIPVVFGFVAATIGGTGSLVGAALGGMLLGITSIFLQVNLPVEYTGFRDAILFTIVLIFMAVRPSGLIKSTGGERV